MCQYVELMDKKCIAKSQPMQMTGSKKRKESIKSSSIFFSVGVFNIEKCDSAMS